MARLTLEMQSRLDALLVSPLVAEGEEEEELPLNLLRLVPASWENIVTEKDSTGETRVNRLTYELSVLQTLRERVRTKEIWVSGAAQFRNPEDDLPRDFDQHRTAYYTDLNHPISADVNANRQMAHFADLKVTASTKSICHTTDAAGRESGCSTG